MLWTALCHDTIHHHHTHTWKKIRSLLKRCLQLVFLTSKGGKGIKKCTIKGNDEVSMVRNREEIPNSLFTVGLISVQAANWWQIALQQFPYTHTHTPTHTSYVIHTYAVSLRFSTQLVWQERKVLLQTDQAQRGKHTHTHRQTDTV